MKQANGRHRMDRNILDRLAAGRGVKSICKELKVGKDRVREVRKKGIGAHYLGTDGSSAGTEPVPAMPLAVFPDIIDRRHLKSSDVDQVLLSHLEWVKERMISGWSPITVFEELPCPGITRSSFYRFLVRHELHKLLKQKNLDDLSGPIVHLPGEALILDWGKLRDVIDPKTGEKRTLWAFVGVMGFSRYLMIRLVWTNSVPVTCDAIEIMLRELGGTPSRVTSDNPKCFSLKADMYDPLLNPAFERFAVHYNNFRIECLPPREPKKKGKVERMMPFARRLFEAYPKTFVSIEHAQAYMDRKCAIANERRHGTTCLKPIEVFLSQEVQTLKQLPVLAYEREEIAYPIIRQDRFVRFSNKYYAVADEFKGKDAVVLGTSSRVSIFAQGRLLETYDRITSQYQTHAIHDHLKKPWQKIEESNAHFIRRAEAIGPACGRMIREVLMKGDGFVDTRIVWGVLALDKKYSTAAVDAACDAALEIGKLSSRFVERLIRLTAYPKNASPTPVTPVATAETSKTESQKTTETFKFARPMSVYQERIEEQATPGLRSLPPTGQQAQAIT